jgi:hypothetical protein
MGLLDALMSLFFRGEKIECPHCGTADARKTSDQIIHCKNMSCPNFDSGLASGGRLRRRYTAVPTRGDFVPEHPVSIRYVNFVGQDRDFSTERDSLLRKKNHIVAQVAPTGRKITLSRDRIKNLGEVESHMPQRVEPGQNWPTGRERQILNYHKNHGTTSPRYEQVRAKYPNW